MVGICVGVKIKYQCFDNAGTGVCLVKKTFQSAQENPYSLSQSKTPKQIISTEGELCEKGSFNQKIVCC